MTINNTFVSRPLPNPLLGEACLVSAYGLRCLLFGLSYLINVL